MQTKRTIQRIGSAMGGLLLVAAALLPSNSAFAQQQITTTQQLKQACETSPGNVVNVVGQSIDISQGGTPTLPEIVNSGCTLILNPNFNFEAESVGMTFTGPFRIQGTAKSIVFFDEAIFKAHSVTLDLTGTEGMLMTDQANLQATAGNVSISMGSIGKINLKQQSLFGGRALEASGAVQISGSDKLSVSLIETRIHGGTGVSVAASGAEATIKTERVQITTNSGAASVTSSGLKGSFEMVSSSFNTGGGVNVSFSGSESGLTIKETTMNGGTGAISLAAGSATAGLGKVSLSNITTQTSGAVSIQASAGGAATLGELGVERLTANGSNVRLESGSMGKTLVKESGLTAGSLVRVATGTGGFCLSELTTVTAPIQEICLP